MFGAISSYSKRLFVRDKTLPPVLTSYDLLKSLALVLMFVDHVGHFFYPEQEWFRVVGRLSVPIWFFLIGYSDKRHVQGAIWIGAIAVFLSTLVSGYYILPLNILFSLALARLWVDRLMVGALQSYESFAGMFFILFFLSFPSMMVVEYGAMGMMFTVYGYMRRYKEGIVITPFAYFGFLAAIGVFYAFFSGASIAQLDAVQMYVLLGGVAALMSVLYVFRSVTYPKITERLGVLVWPLQVMGRHSLMIYAAHLVVLILLMLGMDDDRYGFGQVQIIAPSFMRIINAVIG